MLGLLRLVLFLTIGLSVVYVSLVFWFRAGEAERLKAEWAQSQPPLPEHTFVANGLRTYLQRLHPKLILGVYIVPITVVCGVVLYLNYA
ncbi:hypothetical protein JANAI62_08490 [Jannaschia pagri]|uniref:MAPEG family protein n=1 Tax=Jannaschia pagri TaxID=2829797 RepID=A0ABQ4NII2_9RHOB|nr:MULTISPECIES: hypothetical protein [unclassified Jannaschia]GIT89666.1 hypothetical protein JANAI61_01240 [Jannaschia sp. AI_61]GIT94226.1 hypothetical protein JANAI62_08490 [Jannaschia sp. AI_62]